jgi:hypothetical protein
LYAAESGTVAKISRFNVSEFTPLSAKSPALRTARPDCVTQIYRERRSAFNVFDGAQASEREALLMDHNEDHI